jgi:predicted metal-dependent enzyme (double-stranded beta helix superfamily)
MTCSTTTRIGRGLTALVTDLDRAVRGAAPGRATVDAVGEALRPALGDPQLLRPDQRVGDPEAYRQHLLHVAGDGAFSLVALVWLPGQATPIHDHLAWCVVGVHEGAEQETRYAAGPDGLLVPTGSAVACAGDVDGLLPPGDIHRVTNAGTDLAISLHVYGADLSLVGSSIRRRYDDALVRRTAAGSPGPWNAGPPSARPGRRGRGPRR